jgi:hypothetical protein
VIITVVKSNKIATGLQQLLKNVALLTNGGSIPAEHTVYCVELLCGSCWNKAFVGTNIGLILGEGRESRKDGTYREKRKGRKLEVKNEG